MHKAVSPTEFQAKRMKSSGIHFPFLWVVIGDFPKSFLVRNIITGEAKVVSKQ